MFINLENFKISSINIQAKLNKEFQDLSNNNEKKSIINDSSDEQKDLNSLKFFVKHGIYYSV